MKQKVLILALAALSTPLAAANNNELRDEIRALQQQTALLQKKLNSLQNQLAVHRAPSVKPAHQKITRKTENKGQQVTVVKPQNADVHHEIYHSSIVSIHIPDGHPDSFGFYPTALLADGKVFTYIAGTPIVASPYLGDRPAFDGSDYIVNISSINRDIRLMQQRRRLYDAYRSIGYPIPHRPIIALSGKSEPVASTNRPYLGETTGDINLGSSELDVAAALNSYVEAFIGVAFDQSPPAAGGQRVANSSFDLNLGFVNIGNLDVSPFYFTAGQLYVPFGRYASAMVSSPLPQLIARTKARPFILGYKSQTDTGPYAAGYVFTSDTTLGRSGVGGVNAGYIFKAPHDIDGEIGAGLIGSLADSQGMQNNGSPPFTTFGGFGSITNGSEEVGKVHAVNVHANLGIDRYNLTAEWVGATSPFRPYELSFNGYGAKPQGTQLEAGMTFMAFDKPASLAFGYQWSRESLALNIPKRRVCGVFNISIWKDTVESLEYRHDYDYPSWDFANGIPAPGLINQNTIGTGRTSDGVTAQIGVYF